MLDQVGRKQPRQAGESITGHALLQTPDRRLNAAFNAPSSPVEPSFSARSNLTKASFERQHVVTTRHIE
jgi:hypothetical protein